MPNPETDKTSLTPSHPSPPATTWGHKPMPRQFDPQEFAKSRSEAEQVEQKKYAIPPGMVVQFPDQS